MNAPHSPEPYRFPGRQAAIIPESGRQVCPSSEAAHTPADCESGEKIQDSGGVHVSEGFSFSLGNVQTTSRKAERSTAEGPGRVTQGSARCPGWEDTGARPAATAPRLVEKVSISVLRRPRGQPAARPPSHDLHLAHSRWAWSPGWLTSEGWVISRSQVS